MNHFKKELMAVTGISLSLSMLASNVYAYLDPGTGSYFLQLIIAALVGSLYAIKLYWKKIRSLFIDIFPRGKRNEKKLHN